MLRPSFYLPQQRPEETGSALVLSIFFSMVTVGVVLSGSMTMMANQKKSKLRFQVDGQAKQFAKSGLTEALSWFRRQTDQPVTDFEPRVDLNATPAIIDTMDTEIGLVREFRISGSTWGRYEVWREWADDTDRTREEWREKLQVTPLFSQGSAAHDGTEWRIKSVGYVFERLEPETTTPSGDVASTGTESGKGRRGKHRTAKSVAIDAERIISTHVLGVDIVRLRLSPPGQAALSVRRADRVSIQTGGEVSGGAQAAGVLFPRNTGVVGTSGSILSGTPSMLSNVDADEYHDGTRAVFGVPYERFRSVADVATKEPTEFPSQIDDSAIVVVETSMMEFSKDRPLRGHGVVYVKGNVHIKPGSQSHFTGLLYVDGDLTMEAPAQITGAAIVTGDVTLKGFGDFASITYDETVLEALRIELGKYRFAGSFRELYNKNE